MWTFKHLWLAIYGFFTHVGYAVWIDCKNFCLGISYPFRYLLHKCTEEEEESGYDKQYGQFHYVIWPLKYLGITIYLVCKHALWGEWELMKHFFLGFTYPLRALFQWKTPQELGVVDIINHIRKKDGSWDMRFRVNK